MEGTAVDEVMGREARSRPLDPNLSGEDRSRLREMIRMCYEEGVIPPDIDPGEMQIDGREVRFKVNLEIDQEKIGWLKEHAVTVIFRDGARFFTRRVKDDIVRAYEDESTQDGSFEAEEFRRDRVKVESPNVVSYIAKNRAIVLWLLTKGEDYLTLGLSLIHI